MAYDPSIFNISPYYDDFDTNKGFLRVLFKPGYALQARELTQLQSILQDQLSKVGDHLFKDGSRIVGGGISVRNSSYVMIDVGSGSPLQTVTDYETLVGALLSDDSGNEARVVHYLEPDSDTDGTLILVVDFLSGSVFNGSLTLTFEEDVAPISSISIATVTNTLGQSISSGTCKVVTVGDGIFYVDGFFVRVAAQNFTPFFDAGTYRDLQFKNLDVPNPQLFDVLSKKIGFYVNRDSVTEQEDATLRDPSIGSYNYNAPGADRYKINLVLGQSELDETLDDFVELLRFENGRITKKIDRVTYGDIEKALARRTYDESGSYTVKPFDVVIKANTTDTLNASVSGGKAYVLGYEVENQHPALVPFSKARTTQSEVGVGFPFTVGNVVGVCMSAGADFGQTFADNAVTIGSGSATVRFFGDTNSVVATGYVHGAIPDPQNLNSAVTGRSGYQYKLYLYGISGNVSAGVSGCLYLNTTGATISPFVPSGTATTFTSTLTDYSSLVFELQPGLAIDSVQSLQMVGKLIGDATPTNSVSITALPNDFTRFTFGKNHFLSTIPSAADSAFRFFTYGTISDPGTTDFEELQEVALIKSSGTGVSSVFAPRSGNLRTNTDQSVVTLEVQSVPQEFRLGNLRAVCPVVYTPNISNPNTYRTKVSVSTFDYVKTFTDLKTDENGRKYFLLEKGDVTASYATDVYAITSITANGVDYTNDFELDDGQRDTYYDYSRLYVKDSLSGEDRYTAQASEITVTVSYSYFDHRGLACAPFIGRHSYPSYENIPLYMDPKTGKTVSLANCIDFRRSTPNSTTPMFKPYGRSEFGVEGDTLVSYIHYLPRIDKLCVKADPEDGSPLFFFASGTPDLSPVAPPDPSDALVIATLTIPAYTHNPSDVVVTPVENKRYTMGDIGKIQKRVDEVEVFAKLSLSELEVESKSLRSASDEIEPLKTSIFSDEFYGHSISDVNDSLFSCSIDYERGELRPFFTESNVSLPTPTVSNCVVTPDGVAMLSYDEVQYLDNNQYTKTVKINPSNTVNWLGFMKLSRSIEPYYDTGYRPLIRTNSLMENDNWISSNPNNANGFGTQWNGWESIWTGIEEVEEEQDDIQKRMLEVPHSNTLSAVQSFNSGNARMGTSRTVESVDQKTSKFIRARQLKNRIKYKIGSRTIDRSVVPYIPARFNLSADVYGLKPNTQNLTLYFDGEAIKSGIQTDANGSVVGLTFDIPPQSFFSGSRTVRLSDSAITANSTIAAEAVYHCTGLIEQQDSGSYSTRPPEFRRQITSSEAIAKDPFNRDIDSVENVHWSDPLSQTFFVDKKTNPDGIFVSSVSLFFSSKDSTLPVTLQIRPTVGGYPSPSVVLPFSTVTKLPADVNADSSPTSTVFSFSTPVYLEPGEYSLCLLTNSSKYEVFAAEAAVNAVTNSAASAGRAGNNQLVGTLFTPQGFGPAVQENLTDLMFTVNRCDFAQNGTVTWGSDGGISGFVDSQVVKVYAPEIVPTSANLTRTLGAVSQNPPFKNNESRYLISVFRQAPSMEYGLFRGYNVSPVVDLHGMYALALKMYQDPQSAVPASTYVSRIVQLPEELVSNGLAVFLDANIPARSGVVVHYRYSANGENDILAKPWIRIPFAGSLLPGNDATTSAPFTSVSEIDFRQAYYKTTGQTPDFKAYQIRVDLQTNKQSSVGGFTYYETPAVRSIKAVSFIS